MSVRDEGGTHYYGDDCPGGHGVVAERIEVRKYGHNVPLAEGPCFNCGRLVRFNLAAGIAGHVDDGQPNDCREPWPAANIEAAQIDGEVSDSDGVSATTNEASGGADGNRGARVNGSGATVATAETAISDEDAVEMLARRAWRHRRRPAGARGIRRTSPNAPGARTSAARRGPRSREVAIGATTSTPAMFAASATPADVRTATPGRTTADAPGWGTTPGQRRRTVAERIYRYEVPVDGEWHEVVMTGTPLHVGCRDARVVEFWAIAHGLGAMSRRFLVVGTGEALPPGARYHGTAVAPGERLVWHLVESVEPA